MIIDVDQIAHAAQDRGWRWRQVFHLAGHFRRVEITNGAAQAYFRSDGITEGDEAIISALRDVPCRPQMAAVTISVPVPRCRKCGGRPQTHEHPTMGWRITCATNQAGEWHTSPEDAVAAWREANQ